MPYQSILGPAEKNRRLQQVLGKKSNPFEADFQPGYYAKVNAGRPFVPVGPTDIQLAEQATKPKQNLVQKALAKVSKIVQDQGGAKAMAAAAARDVARTAPEAVLSIADLKDKGKTYHPGTNAEQFLFGKEPVQNIQAKVLDTKKRKGNIAAAGEGALSIASDIPGEGLVAGAIRKTIGKTAAKTAGKEATKTAETVVKDVAKDTKPITDSSRLLGTPADSAKNRAAILDQHIAHTQDLKKLHNEFTQTMTNHDGLMSHKDYLKHSSDIQTNYEKELEKVGKSNLPDNVKVDRANAIHDKYDKEFQHLDAVHTAHTDYRKNLLDYAHQLQGQIEKHKAQAPAPVHGIADHATPDAHLRALQRERNKVQKQIDATPTTPAITPVEPPKVPAAKPTLSEAIASTDTTEQGAKFTKPFLSATGMMNRLGPEGKKLAKMVNDHAQFSRDLSTKWINQIPTVRKLQQNVTVGGKVVRKGETENFAAAVQGTAKPMNAKVAQAVKEWKALTPQIRDEFMKHSGEDLGNIENYFPRVVKPEFLKKDSAGAAQAVKHLIDTAQVPTAKLAKKEGRKLTGEELLKAQGEAKSALDFARKSSTRGHISGSFKFHRDYQLPDHMYDTSRNAVANYIEGAANATSGAKIFGTGKTGVYKKADELIGQSMARGGSHEELQKQFNAAMNLNPHSEGALKVTGKIRAANALTKLGTGAVTNLGQNANTIVKNGFIDTAKGLGLLATKEGRKYVRDTGAFTHGIISDLRETQGFTGIAGHAGAPAFQTVEKFNRYLAAAAGKFHGERLAGRANGKGLGRLPGVSAQSEKALRELNVEGKIGNKLTSEQSLRAGRGSSDKTQFIVDAHTLPAWSTSPWGKVVSQFQTFSYKQTDFVANEILKPMAKGNFMPFARLMAVLPATYGLAQTKAKLHMSDTSNDSTAAKVIKAWRAAGGGGLPESIVSNVIDARKYASSPGDFASNAASHLLGPTVGNVVDTSKSAYSASKGDFKPAKKQAVSNVPVFGPTLKNKYIPSGSATSQNIDPSLKKELKVSGYQPLDTTRKGQNVSPRVQSMTDAEYKKYTETSTRVFNVRAKRAIQDPAYRNDTPDGKKARLSRIMTTSRADVLDYMKGKAPKRKRVASLPTYR